MATYLCRISIALLLLIPASHGRPQDSVVFEDEFTEEERFSCDWQAIGCADAGEHVVDVENDDLVIGDIDPGPDGSGFRARRRFTASVSVQTQVNLQDAEWVLVARADCDARPLHGALGVVFPDGRVRLRLYREGQAVREQDAVLDDFNTEADYVLRLDREGDHVEFRVWTAEGEEPEEPTVEADAPQPESAHVGVAVEDGRATFRWLRVLRLPEPSFCRGDANGDGKLDISDVLFTLNHLFAQGPGAPQGFGDCVRE